MDKKGASSIILGTRTYTLDEFGFLKPSEQWDENFAQGMAKKLGLYSGLTEKHWSIIRYLRDKFLKEKTVPVVVYACVDNKLRLWEFRQLFPMGYHRGACKIAGINYEFMLETNHWLTYESRPVLEKKFKMTETGFLDDFNAWNEEFAHFIAHEWNLSTGLTDRHREIIGFLRRYYGENSRIPNIFETCDSNKISLEELRELFPEGYRRGACRMAGLPFPS
jgi:tRNA 2-thiouridine synthesizing protein E